MTLLLLGGYTHIFFLYPIFCEVDMDYLYNFLKRFFKHVITIICINIYNKLIR